MIYNKNGELVKRDNGSFASFSQEFDSLILHQSLQAGFNKQNDPAKGCDQ